MKKKLIAVILSGFMVLAGAGCATQNNSSASVTQSESMQSGTAQGGDSQTGTALAAVSAKDSGYFTSRDLEQEADLSDAVTISVDTADEILISKAGVYVLTGTAANKTIIVNAGDDDKVQLVLSGLTLTNDNTPCIYVKNADKVFVTIEGDNTLTVSGTFTADGDTNTDAVIFSRDDLVLNGTGTLTIVSSGNGVTSKDTLKVTGGTYDITAKNHGLEAQEAVLVAGGSLTISAKADGIHADDSDDDTIGSFYMAGGTLNITAGDDGIHAVTTATIDGGTITVKAAEGIEGTLVTLNDGDITISASDDGINGAKKSSLYKTPVITINGGNLTIAMGAGDTDAIDSNGNLVITGGTLNITAQSPFDYDGTVEYTGGTLIVNGEQTTTITNQMMGGGMGHGGFGQGGFGQGGFGQGGRR